MKAGKAAHKACQYVIKVLEDDCPKTSACKVHDALVADRWRWGAIRQPSRRTDASGHLLPN